MWTALVWQNIKHTEVENQESLILAPLLFHWDASLCLPLLWSQNAAYGTQWDTFSLGEDVKSQCRQFKNFLSVQAIQKFFVSLSNLCPKRNTFNGRVQKHKRMQMEWHMELFFRARPPGGKMSWKDPILETYWQEPGTRPPGLTQRKLEIAWPPTACHWKMGLQVAMWPQSPSPGPTSTPGHRNALALYRETEV